MWLTPLRILRQPAIAASYKDGFPFLPAFLASVGWGVLGAYLASPAYMRLLRSEGLEHLDMVLGAVLFAGMGLTPVMYGLIWAIPIACISVLLDSPVRFRSAFGLAVHAYIPKTVGLACSGALSRLQPDRMPLISAAALVPPDSLHPTLQRLLHWLDPFSLWSIVILLVDVHGLVAGSWRVAAVAVLGPWLAVTFIAATF